jgi:hypothetical protein
VKQAFLEEAKQTEPRNNKTNNTKPHYNDKPKWQNQWNFTVM